MEENKLRIEPEDTRIFLSSLNRFLDRFEIQHCGANKFNLSESDADSLLIGYADLRAVLEDLEEELREHATDELEALKSQTEKAFEKIRKRLVDALVRNAA